MQELNAAVALWTAQTVAQMDRRQDEMLRILREDRQRLEAQNAELQTQLVATESAHQAQQLAADQQRDHLEAQNAERQAELDTANASIAALQASKIAAEQQRDHFEAQNAERQAELDTANASIA